ncbi:MAG: hypothetical protein GC137_09370 [Alphaproteobacteria bacterium]|nr:hypothetical protein [Alphaproteobacteria bacterium]
MQFIDSFDNVFPTLLELLIFGALLSALERFRFKRAEPETGVLKKDFNQELLLAVSNIALFVPLTGFVALLFAQTTLGKIIPYQMLRDDIHALPLLLQIILGALILDFSTYWRHRFTHFYMWHYHAIHHSAEQITWLTGFRLHPIDLFAGAIFDTIILYVLGFSGMGFLGAMIIIRFMNYFTHLNLNLKFDKPLRYVFASPHYHRWHHANQKDAYDKNFCGAFPIWDILFGTYYHPEELPEKYGLSSLDSPHFPKESFVGWLAYPFTRMKKK